MKKAKKKIGNKVLNKKVKVDIKKYAALCMSSIKNQKIKNADNKHASKLKEDTEIIMNKYEKLEHEMTCSAVDYNVLVTNLKNKVIYEISKWLV